MATTELSHLYASTSAEQRTSLGASCTSFRSGRGEAKNFRIKDSTLCRENARVCQKPNCSAQSLHSERIMLTHCIKPDLACSARDLDLTKLIVSTSCRTSCSMFRTCLRGRSAAIVSQPCLSDGESALNNLTCCAMIFSVRACDECGAPRDTAFTSRISSRKYGCLPDIFWGRFRRNRSMTWRFITHRSSAVGRECDICSIHRRANISEPIIGLSL